MGKRKTFDYPPAQSQRSGCKVGWLCYDSHDDAVKASRVAVEEAKHMANLGYDFGYQVPGSIRKIGDRHEVVIP